jgi:ADP-heptose:LPS heptosyltransferase
VNVLVLRALGLGDLLTGVPALRALRRHWPQARISLATPGWLAPLVNLIGGVDHVLPQEGLDTPLHCSRRPDVAVNLHGKGPQSHRLLAGCKADRMLALHPRGPRWRPDEHEVRRWCRMLAWYGIPSDPDDLDLPLREDPCGPAIVHPGAKDPGRRWPAERFAEVARGLEKRGTPVVVTGDSGDVELAGRVAREAGLPRQRVLAGRTDTGELATLVAQAPVVISGDTGIAHLATACGTPSVVLFAALGPHLWGPPENRPRHRPLWRPMPGDPKKPTPTTHPALLRITGEEVLRAADEVRLMR